MKGMKLLVPLLTGALLTCGVSVQAAGSDPVEEKLSSMTTQEKVAQLFVVTPEQLTNGVEVTTAGAPTLTAMAECPVGGIIYDSGNVTDIPGTYAMTSAANAYSESITGLPLFTMLDEEGGEVERVAGHVDGISALPSMAEVGATGNTAYAQQTGQVMGQYLKFLGFNVDLAPVADVYTNPENTVVKTRSFGTDPSLVSAMSLALADGLESQGVCATYKHFPGHGATAGDTHEGYAYTDKTLEELTSDELVPFAAAVQHGAKFMMVGHICLPNVTGDNTPASLSYPITTGILRDALGYDGIIITDALNMGAITRQCTSGEAAVKAFLAGADLLLMPEDFQSAYQTMLSMAESGQIPMERLDASVRRILSVKLAMQQ